MLKPEQPYFITTGDENLRQCAEIYHCNNQGNTGSSTEGDCRWFGFKTTVWKMPKEKRLVAQTSRSGWPTLIANTTGQAKLKIRRQDRYTHEKRRPCLRGAFVLLGSKRVFISDDGIKQSSWLECRCLSGGAVGDVGFKQKCVVWGGV